MRVLVGIDDTDMKGTKGTGHLASDLSQSIREKGWGTCYSITRHQLFVHPDIPYTSHNSAMCFFAEIQKENLVAFIGHASEFLVKESAPGSDPGLCVAVVERINNHQTLISFGYKAKETILVKEEAYALARGLGIHLSEHGGTGQGVIGSLAGVGLRLSGNDGRFRGKHKIETTQGAIRVQDIYSQVNIDSVKSVNGEVLADHELIILGEKVKSVLLNGQSVLLVEPAKSNDQKILWQTLPHEKIKKY